MCIREPININMPITAKWTRQTSVPIKITIRLHTSFVPLRIMCIFMNWKHLVPNKVSQFEIGNQATIHASKYWPYLITSTIRYLIHNNFISAMRTFFNVWHLHHPN